jgi:two-component system LytT family response regulator
MIKAVIIDDEQLAIESLQWEIENFSNEVKIIETFTNPKEAISGINYLKPDLVFLDIEMPEIDGFQLLQLLDYRNFDLIITTAYNQYAIQAFKANAIDYLLKPIDPDDLLQAIEKVKMRQSNNNSTKNIETVLNKLIKTEFKQKKIPLNLNNKIVLVEAEEILYCKSDGGYTNVFMKNGESYLVSRSIKSFEELLPKEMFLRNHKSYIVNLNEIKELLKQGTGELVMSNDKIIPVSRSHKQNVLDALHIS